MQIHNDIIGFLRRLNGEALIKSMKCLDVYSDDMVPVACVARSASCPNFLRGPVGVSKDAFKHDNSHLTTATNCAVNPK
jgi:hypothetical protein